MDKYNNKIAEKTYEIKRLKKENKNLEDSIEDSLKKVESLQKDKIRILDNLNRVKKDRSIINNQAETLKHELNDRMVDGAIIAIVTMFTSLLYGLLPFVTPIIIFRQIVLVTLMGSLYEYGIYQLNIKKFKALIGNVTIHELNLETKEYKNKLSILTDEIDNFRKERILLNDKINNNLLLIGKLKDQIVTLNVRKERLFGFSFENSISMSKYQTELNI